MGGSATKDFNAVRLDRATYFEVEKIIANAVTQDEMWTTGGSYLIKPISAYREKLSFGDMDLISTLSHEAFEEKLAQSNDIMIIGNVRNKVVNSYALRFKLNGKWSEPFQVDHIQVEMTDFDFALFYFNYNDLGNLIGRIAAAMGMKFGHEGLFLKTYFDKNGKLVEVQGLKSLYAEGEQKNAAYKTETKLDVNFFQALEILGFDKEHYLNGFNNLDEILAFVENSRYFHPAWFDLENRNGVQRRRDRKRPTYRAAVERFSKKMSKQTDLELVEQFNRESATLLPQVPLIKIKERKQIRRQIYWNKRLSLKRLAGVLYHSFCISSDMSPESKKTLGLLLKDLKGVARLSPENIESLNREQLRKAIALSLDELGFDLFGLVGTYDIG